MKKLQQEKIAHVDPDRLAVSTITESDQFLHLRDEWEQLLTSSNSRSVFLTWEWLYTWWNLFSNDGDLNIITVRAENDQLIGVGPFYRTKRWNESLLSAVTFLGSAPISSEYLDIISRSDNEPQVANAILDELLRNAGSVDCLVFTDVLADSLVCRFFNTPALARDFRRRLDVRHVCPYLKISNGKAYVRNQQSKNLRSIIKRKSKKQEKLGSRLVKVSDERELGFYLGKLFELHQKCWKQRGWPGNFGDELIRKFHEKVSAELLQQGRLGLYALELDSTVVAVLYGFEFKGQFFYFQSGFDPDWSDYSPGSVLMGRCIDEAIEANLSVFDYLRGDEQYKSMWSTHTRTTHSLTLIPRGKSKAAAYFRFLDIKSTIKSTIKILFTRKKGGD